MNTHTHMFIFRFLYCITVHKELGKLKLLTSSPPLGCLDSQTREDVFDVKLEIPDRWGLIGSADASKVVGSLCLKNGIWVPWAAPSACPVRCDSGPDQDHVFFFFF